MDRRRSLGPRSPALAAVRLALAALGVAPRRRLSSAATPRRRPRPRAGTPRRPARGRWRASRRTRRRWRAPTPRSSASRSARVEDARSIATLGRERQGSGVLIGDDGLVLTIGYLILEADHVDLVAGGGRRVPARVVAYDLASGFGLVQALAPLGLSRRRSASRPRSPATSRCWSPAAATTRDLSLARMVSRRPFSGYWEYHIEGALFTAPARTDHSGAGLFNADGELVGVGSLVVGNAARRSGPALRGNMFVPVDLLKPILAELRARGSSRDSSRAWLGLNCVEVAGQVHVVRLTPDSPAEAAGLEPGDVIVAVDGMRGRRPRVVLRDALARRARRARRRCSRSGAAARRCACRCTRSTGCRR